MLRDYRTQMGENPVGTNAEIMKRMEKKASDPGGWDGDSGVKDLHMIAENA